MSGGSAWWVLGALCMSTPVFWAEGLEVLALLGGYNRPSWSFLCSLAPDPTPGYEALHFMRCPYRAVSRIALPSPLGQEVRFHFQGPKHSISLELSKWKNADRKTPTCKIWRPIIREKIIKIKRFQAREYSASQSGTNIWNGLCVLLNLSFFKRYLRVPQPTESHWILIVEMETQLCILKHPRFRTVVRGMAEGAMIEPI